MRLLFFYSRARTECSAESFGAHDHGVLSRATHRQSEIQLDVIRKTRRNASCAASNPSCKAPPSKQDGDENQIPEGL